MTDKNIEPHDFTNFLLDDEFIERISEKENSIEYIEDLKKKHPEKVNEIELAVKIYYGMSKVSLESVYEQKQRVWKKIVAVKAKERRMVFIYIAASILLFLAIGGSAFYYLILNRATGIEHFAVTNRPSFNQSQLILSDGTSLAISDYDTKIIYSSDGSNVIVNDTTEVVQEIKADQFNQMIVPYGKYNSLLLSDGTKVWVNSGSRLVYPPVFQGKIREVYIQGEAYFEVARDITKPFFVKTDRFRVEVLGTRFSVQANEKENLFTALLLEGEVSLSSGQGKSSKSKESRLNPGQIAALSADGRDFQFTLVDNPENFVAWKNGYLLFNEEPLNEILKRVSRFYNIDIEITPSLRLVNISGKLDLKDDPERVLKGISVIAKSEIKFKEEKYIFY